MTYKQLLLGIQVQEALCKHQGISYVLARRPLHSDGFGIRLYMVLNYLSGKWWGAVFHFMHSLALFALLDTLLLDGFLPELTTVVG